MRAGIERVILEPLKKETKTASGLYFVTGAEDMYRNEAVVKIIGPGRLLKNGELSTINCKVGDTVLVSKYGKEVINHEGVEYLVAVFDQVMCVVERA
jgi:co-chaperonin GroES (HSP10)